MSCLTGCIREFDCGVGVRLPPSSNVMSPFVTCTFEASGKSITVGNESSPAFDNSISIIGFEYGLSDGHIAKIELVDQAGGAFTEFVDSMVKCTKDAGGDGVTAKFSWGWIGLDCFGNSKLFPPQPPVVKVQLMNLEVMYGEGVIKYSITCTDMMNVSFNMREDHAFGEDGNEMSLKDAIIQLCQEDPPIQVNFYHRNDSNQEVPGIEWEEGGEDGPRGVWTADSLNRLSVITKWMGDFKTKRGRGVIVTVDGVDNNQAIGIREMPDPGKTCGVNSLGTFIVNGGECSNTISFSPNISWPAAFASLSSGGSSGSALDGGTTTSEETKKSDSSSSGQSGKAGLQQMFIPGRTASSIYGAEAVEQSAKAQDAHIKANKIFEQINAIDAELRIIGDASPEFVDVVQIIGRSLSIVAINPFHIMGNGQGCGDWLARPGCNPVLSNKNWMCKGVNHSIREGDYVTTLKVFLATPGIDISPGAPLGGEGSSGYRPKNLC